MADLSLVTFTKKSDVAKSVLLDDYGWIIYGGAVVDTLAGDDSVIGSSTLNNGISNFGYLFTRDGSDYVSGASSDYYGILNGDFVIDTGAGNDTVAGTSANTIGIINFGVINAGTGNDNVLGSGATGIYNINSILAGDGNDKVVGTGSDVGIFNGGLIDAGTGNDTITGSGSVSGVSNFGTILAGSGNDIVDALVGGFSGSGTTDLGSGNDNVKGFGGGTFLGGTGTDALTFNTGTYAIVNQGGGNYLIGNSMLVNGFEAFGVGANQTNFLVAAAAGSVTFA